MAKKTGVIPEEIQRWFDRIHNAEKLRAKIAEQYGWTRLKNELKGQYKDIVKVKGTPIIPVNLVHGFIRTAVPSLYFRDPRFNANPQGAQYIPTARIVEPILNYKWRCLNMKHEVRKAIADTVGWAGHGWIKLGYTATAAQKPAKKGAKYETDITIQDEKIWAYRVSPNNITFNNDESIDPPNDCRWIAHEIFKPLATVQQMFDCPDLKASFVTSYDAVKNYEDSKEKPAFNPTDKSGIEMVRLYEITDIENKKIILLADGYWKKLEEKDFPYKFKGFNYEMLKFNDVPDEPYPYSDLYAAEAQIWEITKLLSMALNHVKRFNRQLFIQRGSMTESDKAKFTQGLDGALIEIKGELPNAPNYPQLQPDIYNLLDRLQMIFDNIVGQSAFDRGSTAQTKTRTLGEVERIQSATGTRAAEKLDTVQEFTERIAEKILALTRQYTDVPEFVAVTGHNIQELNQVLKAPTPDMSGKMADETGFYFTKQDLQGKYSVRVVAGSTKPLDHDYRNELLIQILRFGQGVGIQPNDPVSNEIGRELFNGLDMVGVGAAFEDKIKLQNMQMALQKLDEQKQQLEQQVAGIQQKGAQAIQQTQQQVAQGKQALAQIEQAIQQRKSMLVGPGGLNGGAL